MFWICVLFFQGENDLMEFFLSNFYSFAKSCGFYSQLFSYGFLVALQYYVRLHARISELNVVFIINIS